MVVLYQFPPMENLSSVSPFCTKSEVFLRLAGIEYKSQDGNPRLAPKGKLPYIKDGETLIGDSSFIIKHCTQKFDVKLNEELSLEQQSLGHILQKTIEENFYWVMIYCRWIQDDGWAYYRKIIGGLLPAILSPLILWQLRRELKSRLDAHGMGRHGPQEIYQNGMADINAFAGILGKQQFAVGDKVSSFDAGLYGFLWHMLDFPVENPIQQRLKEHQNLMDYIQRMHQLMKWKE